MPDCLIATNEMANFQEMMFSIQRIVKKQLNTRLRKFAPWHFWSFTPWSNSAVIEPNKKHDHLNVVRGIVPFLP